MADGADPRGRPTRFIARLLETLLLLPWGGREKLRRRAWAQVPAGPKGEVLFLSVFLPPSVRIKTLREAWGTLPPGGSLVLLDYNTPRQWWRRLLAIAWFSPWLLLGVFPRQRLRYPVAREAQEAGFQIKSLHLLGGECFQIVVATKPPSSDSPSTCSSPLFC